MKTFSQHIPARFIGGPWDLHAMVVEGMPPTYTVLAVRPPQFNQALAQDEPLRPHETKYRLRIVVGMDKTPYPIYVWDGP